MATTLPLTYVRGYCLHCGGYDLHIQGCYCRKCWAKVVDAKPQPCGRCGELLSGAVYRVTFVDVHGGQARMHAHCMAMEVDRPCRVEREN